MSSCLILTHILRIIRIIYEYSSCKHCQCRIVISLMNFIGSLERKGVWRGKFNNGSVCYRPIMLSSQSVLPEAFLSLLILFILSRNGVNIDGVCIGNRIYWTLRQLVTTNNYDSLAELHTSKITATKEHTVFSVFTSRFIIIIIIVGGVGLSP
jgi:hypothetical protein